MRSYVAIIAAWAALPAAAAPPALHAAAGLPPAVPDTVVGNEIVVELDSAAAAVLELAGLGPVGLTMSPALDLLGLRFGVTSLRKQFAGADPLAAAASGRPDLSAWYVVTFNPGLATPHALVQAYQAQPAVREAQVIGVHAVSATPNDGSFPSQWHLSQANDRDMDAPEAWDIETGDPAIIAAMLDTGVRYYHKDLGGSAASAASPTAADGNMWINALEKNGTAGFDDDGNGFVDDWVGWDFVDGATSCWAGEDCSTQDNDPRDFNGHGTHCAGNIAALNNNGYATCSPAGGWGTGVNQPAGNGATVMAMRIGWSGSSFGQEVGFVRMDFAASALFYAADNGARIASCSWGSSNSGGIGAAVDYFVASGGLVFKAAGNSNSQTADFLCARPDVYCVAATDANDVKASFSSYGTWVDISGPGVNILSSYHNHNDPTPDYVATVSGTSMATPLVAGAAAAVWSAQPAWTAAQVWAQVRDTADDIDAQNPAYVGRLGSGRVNLFNAVNIAPGCQNNAECDDGDPCNGAETCSGGACQPGSITDCNGNAVADSCDIASGSSDDCNGNAIPDECEGGNPCGGGAIVLVSFTSSTALPGAGTVENEDVAQYDTAAGTWSVYFDGSDVGLSSFDIDALAVLPGGQVLLSLTAAGTIGGVSADDSDILQFTPVTLGPSTSGTWALYFDGSDVGLSTNDEDIDALAVLSNGHLVISVTGSPTVSGLSGLQDEDLIRFTPTSLGAATAGSWSYYFDGSDVGLASNSSEDVDAVAVNASGLISLSTLGGFSVTGLAGADEDVFDFSPTALGSTTSGTFASFVVGASAGIPGGANVDAVEVSGH
jgi:subtilisin family serine protease